MMTYRMTRKKGDCYPFDSSLPKERWSDQWHQMTHAQVKEAMNENSKLYYPKRVGNSTTRLPALE